MPYVLVCTSVYNTQTASPYLYRDAPPSCQNLISHPPPDPAAGHRRDLTHLRVLTIDDEGTEEVDDGLSVEELPGSSSASDGATQLRSKIW